MRRGGPEFAFVFLVCSCLATFAEPKREILIATAANLSQAMPEIGRAFERETSVHPVFSFASTAQLANQIEQGAPFDVFIAADSEHVSALEHRKFLTSSVEYGRGILVLWVPPKSKANIAKLEDLTGATVRVVAIAQPKLAPYGAAAVEALQKAGLWERVLPKVVYSANINAAMQYGISGNADAVITALSLVRAQPGVIRIDPSLHSPIRQSLGILTASKHQTEAMRFRDFLITGKGRDLLDQWGYQTH